jgi:surface protein
MTTNTSVKCFESVRELQSAVDLYLFYETNARLNTSSNSNNININNNATSTSIYGYPIGTWCVSNVNDFGRLFSAERNPNVMTTFNEDISKWDTSNGINMDQMFAGAESFNQNLSLWNISSVTSMKRMFEGSIRFEGIGLESWDVSAVVSMSQTFYNAKVFNANLSQWDVSSVTNTENMFHDAIAYEGIGIENWDVSSMKYTNGMFWNAMSFNANISSWNVQSIVNMENMFRDATQFDSDVSQWNIANVFRMSSMFQGASNFHQNLCPWGSSLDGRVSTVSMFKGTSCPEDDSPTFVDDTTQSSSGPFCFDCNATTITNNTVLPATNSPTSTAALPSAPTTAPTVNPLLPTTAPPFSSIVDGTDGNDTSSSSFSFALRHMMFQHGFLILILIITQTV